MSKLFDLFPGMVFIYKGPRRHIFGRRSFAIGEVLAVDDASGIVHVRTLRSSDQEGEGPKVDIGHIPVLARQLARDLVEVVGKAKPDVDCWSTVNDFRRRFAAGEVGAFRARLWKAEMQAREALPEAQVGQPIHHTFVTRMEVGGNLSTVEVSV